MHDETDPMTAERVAAAYDHIAADYAVINTTMPPHLAELATRFLARLGPGTRVLDVGCGAGRDMAWMETRGATVTGIDLSSGMLARAREIVRGELLEMDMRHLDLPDGHFDGVWCCASLLHLPKTQAPIALTKMRRVLVPDGTLYLGVQEGEGEVWENAPYGSVERLFARYTSTEADTLLSNTGYTVIERGSSPAGVRRWLNFLATAGHRP